MNFIIDVFKGIAIGAGAILPGLSSGVLCVIFGIYEKLLDSVLNFFKDIKQNIKFLFPILVGIAIGVVLFGNILRMLFNNFEMQTKACFIGIILGGIPALVKTANSKKGFRLHYLVYTIIAFLITYILICAENYVPSFNAYQENNYTLLILAGFLMSIGVVVPGVSSTIILMLLGVYDIYLNAISTVNLEILIPIGCGLVFGGYIFLKIINYCLNKFPTQTYYTILGFVLGSLQILCPSFTFNFTGIASIILLIMGIYVSLCLEKT